MDDWSIQLRVVYQDLPNMIEVETRVRAEGWSACSRAYCPPDFLAVHGQRLIDWSRNPQGPFRLEAGASPTMGRLVMEFYTIDMAGHVMCALSLASGSSGPHARPAENWRFAAELPTEPGLIERFGRECLALAADPSRTAALTLLAR